jgi:hypothetical protein
VTATEPQNRVCLFFLKTSAALACSRRGSSFRVHGLTPIYSPAFLQLGLHLTGSGTEPLTLPSPFLGASHIPALSHHPVFPSPPILLSPINITVT